MRIKLLTLAIGLFIASCGGSGNQTGGQAVNNVGPSTSGSSTNPTTLGISDYDSLRSAMRNLDPNRDGDGSQYYYINQSFNAAGGGFQFDFSIIIFGIDILNNGSQRYPNAYLYRYDKLYHNSSSGQTSFQARRYTANSFGWDVDSGFGYPIYSESVAELNEALFPNDMIMQSIRSLPIDVPGAGRVTAYEVIFSTNFPTPKSTLIVVSPELPQLANPLYREDVTATSRNILQLVQINMI